MNLQSILSSYQKKRVLVTGDTGFKGTWLCKLLDIFGAEITGFGLPAGKARQELLSRLQMKRHIRHIDGDVRDFSALSEAVSIAKPDIVFHLAAQPLVLEGYKNPLETYTTNVLGTVNLLEALRRQGTVKSIVNVTTDKVYENHETKHPFSEDEALKGNDPYSNSKSCSDIVTYGYAKSFFESEGVAVSVMRAGNVIGGGDFAENRIVPDCVRGAIAGKTISVRNPHSVRPYQHVLEAVIAYAVLAVLQQEQPSLSGAYNIGPRQSDSVETGELVKLFCTLWEGATWEAKAVPQPKEADVLLLDCTKINRTIGWQPCWDIRRALAETVAWSKVYYEGGDISAEMEREISSYLEDFR